MQPQEFMDVSALPYTRGHPAPRRAPGSTLTLTTRAVRVTIGTRLLRPAVRAEGYHDWPLPCPHEPG